MYRPVLTFLLCWLTIGSGFAQTKKVDSLQVVLAKHPQTDTFRVNRLNELILAYGFSQETNPRWEQQSRSTAQQAVSLAKQLNYADGQAYALLNLVKNAGFVDATPLREALELAQRGHNKLLQWELCNGVGYSYQNERQAAPYFLRALTLADQLQLGSKSLETLMYIGFYYRRTGNYSKALDYFFKALKGRLKVGNQLKSLPNDPAFGLLNEATIYTSIAQTYLALTDYEQTLVYLAKAQRYAQSSNDKSQQQSILLTMGDCYRLTSQYPKAIVAYQQLLNNSILNSYLRLDGLAALADAYERAGNLPAAFGAAFQMITFAKRIRSVYAVEKVYVTLGRAYQKTHQVDSAFYYGHQALRIAQKSQEKEVIQDASQVLASLYAHRQQYTQAYTYQSRYVALKDSLNNEDVVRKATAIRFNEQMSRQQSQITLLTKDRQLQAEATRRQRQLLYTSLVVLALIGSLLALLYRNNHQQQKANALLEQQKTEIQEQRDQTQQALTELKATQQQLIQREKLASLGELTAGIAHEIQNPLNFVNNFAEVSSELIDELTQEAQTGHTQDVLAIVGDLRQNLYKIRHHGGRASAIVKGMLEHSRTASGNKEPTNVNSLADEYLKLAYHGIRAKDTAFTCELVTHFKPNLPLVNLIPQEIGRVLLNLFSNAFYTVRERKQQTDSSYQPTITVTTLATAEWVQLRIADNGTGMSENVQQKIFQPFFTT